MKLEKTLNFKIKPYVSGCIHVGVIPEKRMTSGEENLMTVVGVTVMTEDLTGIPGTTMSGATVGADQEVDHQGVGQWREGPEADLQGTGQRKDHAHGPEIKVYDHLV